MRHAKFFKLWIILMIAFVPFAIYMESQVWKECRDYGHSVLYCVTLLSGK